MRMELRQLEYFVAVAEEASFTRAAARLHVAQPGVSAQVRRLEAELGEQLLDRSGRSVRPTEAGVAVLPHARAALASVGAVRGAIEELTGLVRGRVAIGMVSSYPSAVLPDLLASFSRLHPDVEITLGEDNSDRLVQALQHGELDLALIGSARTGPPPGLATQTLTDEPLVAAVSHTHPLATRSTLTVAALAGSPLMCLPRGTGIRTALDDACATAGVEPRIAFEASDPVPLALLAARGLGVAILPASLAAARSGELHAIALTRPQPRGRIELAWRAEGPVSPAARALTAHARRTLAG